MGIYAYRTFLAVIVAVVIIVLGVLWYSYSTKSAGMFATTTPITIATTTPVSQSGTTTVQIAVLDVEGATQGKSRGCDKVVMIDRTVATTTTPLTAALKELFSISTTSVSGWFNYIDRTNETLNFDHVTIASSTANVYLTGKLSGLAGVCDDPRTAIQIEETALQFGTVNKVKLFLNGEETTLTPSEK